MSNLSTTFHGGGEIAYSPATGLLFGIVGSQVVSRDARTGQVVGTWNFPADLSGISVSPDGRYVVVGQQFGTGPEDATVATVHRIDLRSGAVDDVTFPLQYLEYGIHSIAVAADGLVLVTVTGGSGGHYPVRTFEIDSAEPDVVALDILPEAGDRTWLITSPNQRYVLFIEGNTSNGALRLFDSVTQTVAQTALYDLGTTGFYSGQADVTDTGMVAAYAFNELIVYGPDLQPIHRFPALLTINTKFTDVQFTADGQNLLLWNVDTDRIDVYRVSDWARSGELDPGLDIQVGNGRMDLTADGQVLLLQSYGGENRLIDLALLPTLGLTGTAADNVIHGLPGADHISGLEGADTLFGGGGADVLEGGAGDDVLTGGAGDDRIDGGSGDDVLMVAGAASDYRLLMDGDDFILKGPDGGDHLTGVELIRFADGRALELNRMYGALAADGAIPDDLLSPAPVDKDDDPFVLPPAPETPPVGGDKAFDEPLVLPPILPEAPLYLNLAARLALSGDRMFILEPDDWM